MLIIKINGITVHEGLKRLLLDRPCCEIAGNKGGISRGTSSIFSVTLPEITDLSSTNLKFEIVRGCARHGDPLGDRVAFRALPAHDTPGIAQSRAWHPFVAGR
jgi:hypothetical protein